MTASPALAGRPTAAGGLLVADADGAVANAIAAAVTHPLGVGQGFRTLRAGPAEVPHHPFAVWRTDFVREAGGFDAGLVRNQDDEFSMRAARHGARIEVIAASSSSTGRASASAGSARSTSSTASGRPPSPGARACSRCARSRPPP